MRHSSPTHQTTRLPLFTFTLLLAGFLLAACGEGGGGAAAGDPSGGTAGSGSSAGTSMISGKPRTSVLYDTEYSFRPNVSNPNDGELTFSVENLPPWAAFDASNGRLHGVPDIGHLGTYANIRIRVSDGKRTASLASFSIEVVATGMGSATLSWTAPTENEDGTPLGDLAGFKVYWGSSRNRFPHSVTIDNPGLTTYVVDQLTPATWYFVATAFDSEGAESRFSNVASKTIR